jgi:predicted RND superfamily exporter protein
MNKIEWKLLWEATYKTVGFFVLVALAVTVCGFGALYLSILELSIWFALSLLVYLIWLEYKKLLFKNGKF